MKEYDLAVVGSGFGGSLLSMIARRLGLRVVLLERGMHPRFAIGESTSPLANLVLEQLAERYDLPRLLPLTTYGAWQRTYPELSCGLKRGFTFFHHEAGRPYRTAADRSNQLAVAASPRDDISDMHWYRADVDHFFVREAVACGVEYLDQVHLNSVSRMPDGTSELHGQRNGEPLRIRARLVADATGPRGFLSRALQVEEAAYENYPATQTLFSHFKGVRRCDAMEAFRVDGVPPYPLDDAALHHVFDGGWVWVLRFNNGITSAGTVLTPGLAEDLRIQDGAPAWGRLLERFPSIGEQFAQAEAIRPFVHSARLPYRASSAAGEGWALLPSAAAFVDPMFSTGIPLTLLGIERLGRILENGLGSTLDADLHAYSEATLQDADWTARFIAACYAGTPDFTRFSTFSMFYFAAASYAEMARRLGKSHLASRFLGGSHPVFAAGMQACAESIMQRTDAPSEANSLCKAVRDSIEPLNIAGLADPAKHNWYGVDLEDVLRGAAKLDLDPSIMRQIVQHAPWA